MHLNEIDGGSSLDVMAGLNKLISLFLLVVYVMYFASANLFVHSHHFQNRIVVHSHPYTAKAHGHTSTEVQLIDLLQESTTTEGVPSSVPECPEADYHEASPVSIEKHPVVADVKGLLLRGPPSTTCNR